MSFHVYSLRIEGPKTLFTARSERSSVSGRREWFDALTTGRTRSLQIVIRFPGNAPSIPVQHFVGAPRIELGLYAPEAYVLPVYYAPN